MTPADTSIAFDLRSAFDALADLPPEARASALANGPYSDAQREELAELLSHLDSADPIPARIMAELDHDQTSLPERIGSYRILGVLGSGGMGQVYRAERADGLLTQAVAIKLIRARHDPALLQHFKRERQVLATLQHPNIARFLDAGLHEGQPWLAMELVDGRPLLDWLQTERPKLEQRMAVFLSLADAVAHAHQRLIVHRDLKPANVLVRSDGQPVLLDFGIAKMLDQESDRTIARFYTPGFAAPEQLAGEPISTAADVYALGVLLHVMLCAEMPEAGKRASTQAATAEAWLAAEAAAVRGDLDFISRMARAPALSDRYPSVTALIDDLQRWRDGLPVRAAPGRLWYRGRKWLRRYRVVVLGSLLLLTLAGSFVWRLNEERQRALDAEQARAREAETANAVTQYLVGLFSQVDPRAARQTSMSAQELLQQATDNLNKTTLPAGDTEARLRHAIGAIWSNLGRFDLADQELQRALAVLPKPMQDSRLAAEILREHARALQGRGRHGESVTHAEQALALSERWMPPDDPSLGHSLHTAGVALMETNRGPEAAALFRRAEVIFGSRRELAVDLGSSHHNLGFIASREGKPAEAETWFRLALTEKIAAVGADDPRTLNSQRALAMSLDEQGRGAEALPLLQDALRRQRRVQGEDSQDVAVTLNELGNVAQDSGDLLLAEQSYRDGLETIRRTDPSAAVHTLLTNNLASLYEQIGRLVDAEALLEQSIALRIQIYGTRSAQVARAQHNLARVLLKLEQPARAHTILMESLETRRALLAPDHADIQASLKLQADIEAALGAGAH
ncbi:hypothetical protein C7S18_17205 [Ahniella affigens]|uniref:Protein kinase domain-containing protein n=1 Tax=Ahniella affigens TaxID=2021234 RepID=A0A2P1PVG1_9GAMM|nr:serine/threonine-protein kinase [Ahniella affigens]AVP98810.1 hypothetical protein C7S18_17205 [Ahniella affigens]